MTDPLVLQAAVRLACTLLPALLSAAIKVSILVGFAFAASRVMSRTRPGLRHGLWLAAMGGSLLIFLLSLNGPLFHLVSPSHGNGAALAVISTAVFPASHPLEAAGGMPGLAAEIWRRASSGSPWLDTWPLAVLCLWLAGVLSGWMSILWGRFQLLVMTRSAVELDGGEYRSLMRDTARRVGVRGEVRVVASTHCSTPFTFGVARPFIVLPTSMLSWSAAEKRSVFLHELHHVRNRDSFLLGVAYATCSLLWFIPPVWAAYARLYLEQEKACDAEVLESGVNPQSYATCIVDTAQFSREPALPAGLSFLGRRKRVLKDRIMSILKRKSHVRHGSLMFGPAVLILGVIAVMSASSLDAPNEGGKKYGSLLLREYTPKTPDEVPILATLGQCEAAFTSHDLGKFCSLFTKDAVYHPCGVSAKYPIQSKYCRDLISYNFGFLKFEKYYDPRITVEGRRAVVTLLLETGDYLANYTFVLVKQDRGWIVSETDYTNVHWKG